MSSNNLSIEDWDSSGNSEVLSDKETQTSSTFITDSFDLVKGPSRPLPKGIDITDVEPTVKSTILDRRIFKDLSETASEALETESFIKEIVNTNPSITTDELTESLSPQNYCKQVARTYLKTRYDECEDHTESIEQLIHDSLEPDYQPCFEVLDGIQDIQERNNPTYVGTMDPIPNVIFNQDEKPSNNDSDIKKDDEETNNHSTPEPSPANTNVLKSDSPSDNHELHEDVNLNENKELNKGISIETITAGIKESLTALEKSAGSYLEKIEVVIGVKKPENPDKKPTVYPLERPEVNVSPSRNVQTETGSSLNGLKNLLNNPGEKFATFTGACKDFAENLINNNNEKFSAVKDSCKDFADNLIKSHNEKFGAVKDSCKDFADNLIKSNNETFGAVKDSCKDFADNLIKTNNETFGAVKDSCKGIADNLIKTNNEAFGAVKDSCKDFADNIIKTNNETFGFVKDSCKNFAENILQNPDEKINTMKNTCKDYADKLYTSSKEAVTLISEESSKILSKSYTDLTGDDNPNEAGAAKTLRNISAESIGNFLFKKAENKPADGSSPKAITGTSRISDSIPAGVKNTFKKVKEDIIAAKFDKSSPYDRPLPKDAMPPKPPSPPEPRLPTVSAIDHTDPPTAANVFDMIRSKIFSIFGTEEKSNEPEESQIDEDEEDPFERFMEQ